MPTICGGLAANVTNSCDAPPSGGLGKTVTLFNFDDIIDVTTDADDKLIVTDINLKAGSRGYTWDVLGNTSNQAAFELVKKDWGGDMFTHTLNTVLTEKSTDNKKSINDMRGGLYVAAIVNRSNNTDVKVELLGLNAGLEISTLAWNTAENDGIYSLTLASAEGQEEPFIPSTFQVQTAGVYSQPATLSALTAYLTPAV